MENNNYSKPLDGIGSEEKNISDRAKRLLAAAKEKEKKEGVVAVRVDKHTIKLVRKSKAIKLGLIKG